MLPILSESAENSINPSAITPIFDGLDCPQNEHYSTTARERRNEKLLGDQINQRHNGGSPGSPNVLSVTDDYEGYILVPRQLFRLPAFGHVVEAV